MTIGAALLETVSETGSVGTEAGEDGESSCEVSCRDDVKGESDDVGVMAVVGTLEFGSELLSGEVGTPGSLPVGNATVVKVGPEAGEVMTGRDDVFSCAVDVKGLSAGALGVMAVVNTEVGLGGIGNVDRMLEEMSMAVVSSTGLAVELTIPLGCSTTALVVSTRLSMVLVARKVVLIGSSLSTVVVSSIGISCSPVLVEVEDDASPVAASENNEFGISILVLVNVSKIGRGVDAGPWPESFSRLPTC